MVMVRTIYDPVDEIAPEVVSEYSQDIYYYYGPVDDGIRRVIAVVHDMPGNTWVVDAEQGVIDLLSNPLTYVGDPNPLFYVAVRAYGKYAQAIAPNPTGGTYFGHPVVSRRPVSRTWEEFRNIEYQIDHDNPPSLAAIAVEIDDVRRP